jgi:rhamnosyltransferase
MKIGALIIFYNPDLEVANKVICDLSIQVNKICIVDNSKQQCKYPFKSDKIKYIFMNGNKGIAAAQNQGIKYFIQEDYDYIISCDQDTLIGRTTIIDLLQTMEDLTKAGVPIGAIAPIGIDHYSHKKLSYSIAKIRETFIAGHELLEVTHTMNSMSLIPVRLFKEVGGMEEDLFIDAVDCEWCWRAHYLTKVRFFYDTNILMDHRLGIATKKCSKVYEIHITPPFRMYFQYRNYLWLIHRKYTPQKWILYNGIKYIAKIIYYTLFSSERISYLKHIIKGMKDGIKSQSR